MSWRLLGEVARPLWPQLLLAVLLGAGTVASGVALLGTAAHLIATAAVASSIAELQVAVVGVRLFGVSRALLRYLERLVAHGVSVRLLASLRVRFFQKLEPLAPARLESARTSDLLARAVADVDALESFFVRGVAPPLVAVLVGAGVALYLGHHHPALAAVHLGFFALAGLGLPLLLRRLARGHGVDDRALDAALHASTLDAVQGAAELLACRRADDHLAADLALSTRRARLQRRSAVVEALDPALGGLLSHAAVLGMLLLGVPLLRQGNLDGVDLAVLCLVALASFEALQALPASAQHLERHLAAARRLAEAVTGEPAVRAPAHPIPVDVNGDRGEPALRVQGLGFRYPASTRDALCDLDLDLARGSRVALVGPSGAGKTTLLKLVLGFHAPDRGRLAVLGHTYDQVDSDALRHHLGVLPQQPYLFSGSVLDNLRLARPDASDEALQRALHLAGLDRAIGELPDGLATWLGAQGHRLSAGQRQRLGLARALLAESPLLLLDEPSASLDAHTERALLDTVHGLPGKPALLVVTHRLVAMERYDEILVLDGGRVVERGRHAALVDAGGLYATLWRQQQDALIF